MKVLAIRFARLGDVVLLLPALSSLKHAFPDIRLTLLTGNLCAPLAEMCPAIDEVLAVDRVAMRDGPVRTALRDIHRLVRDVRRRRFDLVIDFHSFRETNLLTWLSGAPVRIGMKKYKSPYLRFCFNKPPVSEDKSLHVSAMFEKVVEATISLLADESWRCEARARQGEASREAPGWSVRRQTKSLSIPDEMLQWANELSSNKLRLALYVDAPVTERIWPPERFAAIADFAIERWAALPIVMSGQRRQDLIQRLKRASRNADQLAVFSDITIPQLAALIASARIFISNDTGPMHIGPAVGVRTLGLFSVGYPEHFRPMGLNDSVLRGNPIEKIQTTDVIAIANEMWITAGPNLRC